MKIILFVFTGAIGFITEVTIIPIAVSFLEVSPIAARTVSFPIAVLTTWMINRKITFTSENRAIEELSKYVFIQVIGGLINLSVYYVIVTSQSFDLIGPALALAASSLCSMLFTYIGTHKLVFTNNTSKINQ